MKTLINNENSKICGECGGKCCKSYACFYSPRDFKDLSFEGLKRRILEGKISIDSYDLTLSETNPKLQEHRRNYFLRARHKDAKIFDLSYGGECMMLTDKGCSYSWEDRPYGGKELQPKGEGYCEGNYDKKVCALEWNPYMSILEKLVEFFKKVDKEELVKQVNDLTEECNKLLSEEISDTNCQRYKDLSNILLTTMVKINVTNMELFLKLSELKKELTHKITKFECEKRIKEKSGIKGIKSFK